MYIYIYILVIYLRGRASNGQALQHDSAINEYWLAEHNIVINYAIWRAGTDTKLPRCSIRGELTMFSTPTNRWTFTDRRIFVSRNKTYLGRCSMNNFFDEISNNFGIPSIASFIRKIDPLYIFRDNCVIFLTNNNFYWNVF